MIPVSTHQNSHKKRRLSVEVYFVLYLTAIILLLGTSPSNNRYDSQLEEAFVNLLKTDFEVDVEKPALWIPILPANLIHDTLAQQLSRDTINIIRAHGSFSSVEFHIVSIEDTLSGDALPVERATLIKESDSSRIFRWNQGKAVDPAVYIVSVEAVARPVIPSTISSPEERSRIEKVVEEKALMRDTAFFSISVTPTSPELLLAIRNPPTLSSDGTIDDTVSQLDELLSLLSATSGSSGFRATPTNDVVTAPPGGTWQQRVAVYGSTSGVRASGAPGVRVSSSGTNYVDLVGTAPSSGEKEVQVSIKTPSGESAVVSFIVRASPLTDAQIPQVMYTGESYPLNFTSEGVDVNSITVSIIENGRRKAQNHSPILEYRPSETSGIVTFERYVDGKLADSYKATLRTLPKPIITIREEGKNSLLIETTTYGQINGRNNSAICRIASGNAKDPEIVDTKVDNVNKRIRTTWKVESKNPSQEFAFKLHVWDQRGQKQSRVERSYEEK